MKRFYVELLGFDVEWEPDADNVYLTLGHGQSGPASRVSRRRAGARDRAWSRLERSITSG